MWYLRILSTYKCICYLQILSIYTYHLYINDTGYRIYDTSCREDSWDLGRTRARTINTERHLTHQHRTYISQKHSMWHLEYTPVTCSNTMHTWHMQCTRCTWHMEYADAPDHPLWKAPNKALSLTHSHSQRRDEIHGTWHVARDMWYSICHRLFFFKCVFYIPILISETCVTCWGRHLWRDEIQGTHDRFVEQWRLSVIQNDDDDD